MPVQDCEDCDEEATGYCVYCGRDLCKECADKETCWKGFHKGNFSSKRGRSA